MNDKRRVGILGLGHVGLPTALGLAEIGCPVIGTDSDRDKVQMISQGRPPFYEPQMGELLEKHLASGRFRATPELGKLVQEADILFICVGTNPRDDGSVDLSQVEGAVRDIAESLNGYKLIVEKSTAPLRTARWIERTILRYRKRDHEFDIACNPEFLREGTAIFDLLHPERIVIGVESEKARSWLEELYRPLGCPILVTDLNTAEAIKHAANAFLALKISYINMVADLCEDAGADVTEVAKGIGFDSRIGAHFLQAGIGYGGLCLPKDLRAFIHVAEEHGVDFSLLKEVERINKSRIEKFLRKVHQALWVLKDKRLAVWGLAFKPNTDDLRETPSREIVERLIGAGALLRLYDPWARDNFSREFPAQPERLAYCESARQAAEGAHAILILTDWQEFRQADWKALREIVAFPIVIDGRNCVDPGALQAAGFEYYGVGRPTSAQPRSRS